MKLLYSLFLLLFAVTLSAQPVPKLRIDPAQAYGGTVSEYFDDIEYIPLETTKESLFGYISDLIITDSSFVITDNDTKSLLFFDIHGKYIKKIKGKRGISPAPFWDRQNNILFVLNDYSSSTTHISCKKYSLLGKELGETFLSQKKIFLINSRNIGNDFFVNEMDYTEEPSIRKSPDDDTAFSFIKIYKKVSFYKSLLSITKAEHAFFFKKYPHISIGNTFGNHCCPRKKIKGRLLKPPLFNSLQVTTP